MRERHENPPYAIDIRIGHRANHYILISFDLFRAENKLENRVPDINGLKQLDRQNRLDNQVGFGIQPGYVLEFFHQRSIHQGYRQ